MVSAWACDQELVLGQRKVDDKSNEITAIPELLELLNIEGPIVTIDAMGCQRKICQKSRDKMANYVIGPKGRVIGKISYLQIIIIMSQEFTTYLIFRRIRMSCTIAVGNWLTPVPPHRSPHAR